MDQHLNLDLIDILVLNENEAASLLKLKVEFNVSMIEQFMDRYQQLKICIVTLGESGACFGLRTLSKIVIRQYPVSRAVSIIDTTGAGDTFVGYILSRLALLDNFALDCNEDVLASFVKEAIIASGLSCEQNGAMNSIPSYDTVYRNL